jgi:hypothetical protein
MTTIDTVVGTRCIPVYLVTPGNPGNHVLFGGVYSVEVPDLARLGKI